MADTQYEDDSNSGTESLSSGPSPYVTLLNATSPSEMLAEEAIDATNDELRSLDNESESFWSNIAQRDETEALEDTSDKSLSQDYNFEHDPDSPITAIQRLDVTFSIQETDPYEAGSTNEPCGCRCHDWALDSNQAAPRKEDELAPCDRWIAERPSEGSTPSYWPHRSNLSLCGACSGYNTTGRSLCTADDGSNEDEKREGRAGSPIDGPQTRY
jgi:hypothetical protein